MDAATIRDIAAAHMRVQVFDGATADQVAELEHLLGAQLPEDLVAFYRACGAADVGPIRLTGTGFAMGDPYDAVALTLSQWPSARTFVALERLPGGVSAYVCQGDHWVIERWAGDVGRLAGSLAEYLALRVAEETERFSMACARINAAVDTDLVNRDLSPRGVPLSPKPRHQQRVLRHCVQDEIVAAWIVQFVRRRQSTVVYALASDSLDGAPIHMGAMEALVSVCAEAYAGGGLMTVQFEGGIPSVILRSAEDWGVELTKSDQLTTDEVHRILATAAGIAPILSASGVPAEAAAAVALSVLQSQWSRDEVALIAASGEPAVSLLLGGSPGIDGLQRQAELELVAAAVLGGMALRALLNRDFDGSREDARAVADVIPTSRIAGGVSIASNEDLPWPAGWRRRGLDAAVAVAAGRPTILVSRPAGITDGDASAMQEGGQRTVIVVPRGAEVGASAALEAPIGRAALLAESVRRLRRLRQVTA